MTTIKTLKRRHSQSSSSVPVSPCASSIGNNTEKQNDEYSDESDDVIIIKRSLQEDKLIGDDNFKNTTCSPDCEIPKKVRFASTEPEVVPKLPPEEDGSCGDYQGWYTVSF